MVPHWIISRVNLLRWSKKVGKGEGEWLVELGPAELRFSGRYGTCAHIIIQVVICFIRDLYFIIIVNIESNTSKDYFESLIRFHLFLRFIIDKKVHNLA